MTMIRPWSDHELVLLHRRPFAEVTCRASETGFCFENCNVRPPAIWPNFTKCCSTYHEKWHSNITKCCAYHGKWHSNITNCCAYYGKWHSNSSKYCTCHPKWPSCLILLTDETSCTTTSLTLQLSQMLRLPRKIAFQNLREICGKRMKRHLMSFTLRSRFEHNPTMIRPWTRHLAPARSPRLLVELRRQVFVLKIATFGPPAICPNFTKCCTYHEKWHCNITFCFSHLLTKYCTCHAKWPSYWLKRYFIDPLHELLLYWAVTLLSCYFTEPLLSWAVTLLSCYWTDLLLYWVVTLLSSFFTELLLYWSINLLSCYFTELLLYWTVTLGSCYFTELLLYWAVTLLSCYFTVTLLNSLHF